ncbi:PleD family two-component system response regulator [Labrys wisconsinensis]|uniref:diguanylate cyclase n=1 Tax=Labrys wisconsinensis TaxID=425677 RepID=A0ABU0J4X7_9HYPH|nr:PleD family two-component system response regulator [Labrys wisconsinensis]MDQ0468690.1 two-component system cell cycle response regulator [Labrys wisconsinensis]
MTGRVLVVDDIIANVKLLDARLTAEYFDVTTATSGTDAIDLCERAQCDIVLLDVMMPGMDGFETCRRLKANPATSHIPVVMVTALDQPADRVRGLEAGADDFLTKPVNDIALLARVRSLIRLKMVTDELRKRESASREFAVQGASVDFSPDSGQNANILIVDDRLSSHERLNAVLRDHNRVDVETRPQEALFRAAEGNYDLVVISLALEDYDGLRLCSQIRSLDRTRQLPMLILAEPEDDARVLRGLDIGINDYLMRPIDRNELSARVRTQVRRKRYADRLRNNVQFSLEMAMTDPLTGLHNRRYFEAHAAAAVEQSIRRDRPMSMLVLDIDLFKSINDNWGHDAGDDVLREFAHRVRKNLRGIDLPCRVGGEEFVIIMPETEMTIATVVAERVRRKIERDPFLIHGGTRSIAVTVSIGASCLSTPADTVQSILKRADQALYRAKRDGRNRVAADAA